MKIITGFLILITCLKGYSQVNLVEIENSIHPEKLVHPYLLFDDNSKKEMISKMESNQELRETYEKLLLEAYRYSRMPEDDKVPGGGDISRFYQDSDTRKFMGLHSEAALNLAFAYQLTGDQLFAEKAFYHAELLCRLESWVYPFHEFPQLYERVWPWNVKDDQVVFSYDLQSARISNCLALVYDWIYPQMEKAQRDRIRGALLEKGILRVRGNYEYFWWSTAYRCNWSGICYSGLGLASLSLLTEDPKLTDVVAKSYSGVSQMYDQLGSDGGWQEGRGYWAYLMGHTMWFIDAVKRLSGEKYNLYLHPKLKDNPADYPLYSLTASFGDGQGAPVGDTWLMNKLVAETGNKNAAWYSDEFLKNHGTIFDFIWADPGIKGIEPDIKSKYFKSIDWAFLRSDFKKGNSFTIACKAGFNNDPHHGHLDCGQFILTYNGSAFIKDLGKVPYDDFYFSAERWSYTEASSKGHNVVFVNGEEQVSAKLKDEPWKENVGGRINKFITTPGRDYVSMTGLEKAYPGIEMKSWQRQFILEKPSLAIVFDRVGTDKNAEIRSRIHPGGEIIVNKNFYTIENPSGSVVVIPFSQKNITLQEGKQGTIAVKEVSEFEWIPYVDAITESNSDRTVTGYIIFPLNDAKPGEVADSVKLTSGEKGSVNLSFKLEDKNYNFHFEDENGILVLKN